MKGSEAMLPCQNRSAPSLHSNALSKSVSYWGWRFANTKFESWAIEMAALHEPTWREAGIFEAVMASIYRIPKNPDLILGIAEKWCPYTKTFVFPWGETAVTLEDVMVLSGFSVLGSPVFATLDSSGKEVKAKLDKEWKKIKKAKVNFVTQVAWMERFMDSGDELEHVAFLVLWLNYFVFPSRLYHLYKAVFPIVVHLSTGTRIALALAVLAHLYAELIASSLDMGEVQGTTVKPNPLLKGEPRLALWHGLLQRTSDARQILDSLKIDSFEWHPYTKTEKEWEFPKFYPEKAVWIPASPNLDVEFVSFARCIKVSQLVGIDNVEHYFPNRVASQFGMLQDVPCAVNQNNLSQEAAWNDYNKPINDLALFIPSRSAIPRVTPTFCEWWRRSFPEFQTSSKDKDANESAETLKARDRKSLGADTSFVPSGSKMNKKGKDNMKIHAQDSTNTRRKNIKQE
ncbi:hypothetical protein AXX17_AT1G44960 [Arabidopsis thaliana]|uniref:Aminotransferase-like plant mobile domain-containing protein n=1 Tax=Arabidopsis thaliana TaxID=3702 RepID=A0A178W7G2_ARATH|nr:hypothetical protein AXX17_AT1G44960 [Arabidopsis thaliana]